MQQSFPIKLSKTWKTSNYQDTLASAVEDTCPEKVGKAQLKFQCFNFVSVTLS